LPYKINSNAVFRNQSGHGWPECGADHNSGWRHDAEAHEALDLPDEDFNYDEFVRREFGSSVKPTGMKTIWWITAILILIATVALYFLSAR